MKSNEFIDAILNFKDNGNFEKIHEYLAEILESMTFPNAEGIKFKDLPPDFNFSSFNNRYTYTPVSGKVKNGKVITGIAILKKDSLSDELGERLIKIISLEEFIEMIKDQLDSLELFNTAKLNYFTEKT